MTLLGGGAQAIDGDLGLARADEHRPAQVDVTGAHLLHQLPGRRGGGMAVGAVGFQLEWGWDESGCQ